MRKLVNLVWFFTFLGFFAALVLSYAFLPEQVGIHANDIGDADEFISKETFFYTALVVFAVSNMVYFFFIRMMDAIPATSGFYFKNDNFKENITGWFAAFITIINLFLIFATAYIALFNNQGDYQMSQFNYLVYIAPILIVFSLVWLAYIFANRHRRPVLE